jgi:hypothetical protein
MGYIKRICDDIGCSNTYLADERNLRRGWGLCCSKSCAASKREKSRPDYDPVIVARNNKLRDAREKNKMSVETSWEKKIDRRKKVIADILK